MEDKGFIKEWIRDCLFGYIADHLDGMDGFLRKMWRADRALEEGVPGYKKWLDNEKMSGGFCWYVGMHWFDMCDTEEKFIKFMKDIDLGSYIDKFKEDFEVEIVKVEFGDEDQWFHRFYFDIIIHM